MRIAIVTLHVRSSSQAVALAAGCLKAGLPPRLGAHTRLFDWFPEQDEGEIFSALLTFKADLIAFPLYVWNRTRILGLCRQLKQSSPERFLCAGGPEACADPWSVLEEGRLDAVIIGEGDLAFARMASRLAEGKPLDHSDGVLRAGATRTNEVTAAPCPDPDLLPSPWLTRTLPLKPGAAVLWEVARGCHFNCAFCFDAKGQRGVRPLPFERLRRELELFHRQGVSQIWILDSTFNAPPERARRLLSLLLKTAPHIHYHIEAKAELLDDETIALLAELSCSVQIGLQSSNHAVLKPLHRNFNPKLMEKRLAQLSARGVTFGLDLIYGLPNDNHEGFQQSLNFALRRQPNQVDIFPLAILPGTEIQRQPDRFGVLGQAHPPYLIHTNSSYSATDLERSQELALAADLFYNRGRAVGFFPQLCQALKLSPVDLLKAFGDWLKKAGKIVDSKPQQAECWRSEDILPLQIEFVTEQFQQHRLRSLTAIAVDLIHYHFCCAETLLLAPCRPLRQRPSVTELKKKSWMLHPGVLIQHFNYPLEGLEALGGESLKTMATELAPDPGFGIFLRQEQHIRIEALDAAFTQLLKRSRRAQSGARLLDGLDQQTGLELLSFAIVEGLLTPVSGSRHRTGGPKQKGAPGIKTREPRKN